ncbi:MAG: hypothetical protein JNM93_04110 [Bacteriovoracaceae bacterium]|nr:hypothetical protein [Bacteriovoracaceae bacterium]
MKYFISVLLMMSVAHSYADSAGVLNEDGSFRLKDESIKTLGIDFSKLSSVGPWSIPLESIVKIKFTKGVYRRYEGAITFVLVNIIKYEKDRVLVSSPDLEQGDEVAIKGTSYLRLAEADLKSDTVDNCSH